MFVLMYFLLILPQAKNQKEHQKMITELKKGDKIVMNGGLIGTIAEIYETEFKLEVEKSTFVRVSRAMVATKITNASSGSAVKTTANKAPTKRNKSSKTKK
jgi:preprotein translocase subunit YajC